MQEKMGVVLTEPRTLGWVTVHSSQLSLFTHIAGRGRITKKWLDRLVTAGTPA